MNEEDMKEEEWNFYFKADGWTLREAILLLEGKSPSSRPPYSKFYNAIEMLAIRSNEAGLLPTIGGSPLDWTTDIEVKTKPSMDWCHSNSPAGYNDIYYTEEVVTEAGANITICPKVFLRWAIEKIGTINDKLLVFFKDCNQIECSEDGAEDLSPSEHRKLGQLKSQVEKIPFLVKASVAAALHIASIDGTVTRNDIREGVRNAGLLLESLTCKEVDYIWDALPRELQHHGAPKKRDK